MQTVLRILPEIHDKFSGVAHLFSEKELREILDHNSLKVYYNVHLSETDFSLSELLTTTARAEIILTVLKNLIDRFGKDVSVLDLACSPGYFMLKSAQLGINSITGVDARLIHLNQFKFLNSFYQFPNIEFVHSDMYEYLQSEVRKRKQYDICFLFGFLYHTATPVELLRDIKRICRRCLIIDTTLSFGFGTSLNIFEEEISWSRASTDKISFMPSLLAVPRLLEAAGFQEVQRIIPPYSLQPYIPGGSNIDYYFDQTRLKVHYASELKRLWSGIANKLHIRTPAPRAIFVAYT